MKDFQQNPGTAGIATAMFFLYADNVPYTHIGGAKGIMLSGKGSPPPPGLIVMKGDNFTTGILASRSTVKLEPRVAQAITQGHTHALDLMLQSSSMAKNASHWASPGEKQIGQLYRTTYRTFFLRYALGDYRGTGNSITYLPPIML